MGGRWVEEPVGWCVHVVDAVVHESHTVRLRPSDRDGNRAAEEVPPVLGDHLVVSESSDRAFDIFTARVAAHKWLEEGC